MTLLFFLCNIATAEPLNNELALINIADRQSVIFNMPNIMYQGLRQKVGTEKQFVDSIMHSHGDSLDQNFKLIDDVITSVNKSKKYSVCNIENITYYFLNKQTLEKFETSDNHLFLDSDHHVYICTDCSEKTELLIRQRYESVLNTSCKNK